MHTIIKSAARNTHCSPQTLLRNVCFLYTQAATFASVILIVGIVVLWFLLSLLLCWLHNQACARSWVHDPLVIFRPSPPGATQYLFACEDAAAGCYRRPPQWRLRGFYSWGDTWEMKLGMKHIKGKPRAFFDDWCMYVFMYVCMADGWRWWWLMYGWLLHEVCMHEWMNEWWHYDVYMMADGGWMSDGW